MFGINRMNFAVQDEIYLDYNGVADLLPSSEVDLYGTCVKKKKLPNSLVDNKWKSPAELVRTDLRSNIDKIAVKEDVEKCQPVIDLIKRFIEIGASPECFTPADLRYDNSRKLWFLKFIKMKLLNYHGLEEFIFKFSENNITVYTYIMEKSGMFKHNFGARTYPSAIEEILFPSEDAVIKVQNESQNHPFAIIAKQISELIARCKLKLQTDHGLNISEETLKRKIPEVYHNTGAGRYWPTFERILITTVLKETKKNVIYG